MVKNSQYWENRVAKKTWQTYNNLEERNRALFEMYKEASGNVSNELYKVAERINGGKAVSLSDMHKFNRLMGLKKNFEKTIRGLAEQTEDFARENMQQGFKDTYKVARTAISSTAFATPDKRLMDEMLDRPWRGDSFSARLWKNTSVLAKNLNESLVIGLQQGKTISEISIKMSNAMMQGFNVTHRLVRTETMHYLNNSAVRAYKDAGVEYVQIWAAEDERTCKECMKYHGKIYPIDKVPILPIHAHCRCTYLPVTDKKLIEAYLVENSGKNDIIKNIDIDDMKVAAYGKNIDDKIIEEIYNSIKPGEREGAYFINETVINSIPSSGIQKVLMQVEPIAAGATSMLRLKINSDIVSGKTLSQLNAQIRKSPDIVANNLQEAAIHEAGHAKLISGLNISEIEELYKELSDKGIKGVSKIAKLDGAEAIAEIEVLLSRNEPIPDEAMELYKKYIKRRNTR